MYHDDTEREKSGGTLTPRQYRYPYPLSLQLERPWRYAKPDDDRLITITYRCIKSDKESIIVDLILQSRCSGTERVIDTSHSCRSVRPIHGPVERFHEATFVASVAEECVYAYEQRDVLKAITMHGALEMVLNPSVSLGACERPFLFERQRS
jgi:hypothetical protein